MNRRHAVKDKQKSLDCALRYPEVLVFFQTDAYSLKLKFRPELSVIGEEGPALETALEGMLPCHSGWLGGRRDVSDPEEDRGCCGL